MENENEDSQQITQSVLGTQSIVQPDSHVDSCKEFSMLQPDNSNDLIGKNVVYSRQRMMAGKMIHVKAYVRILRVDGDTLYVKAVSNPSGDVYAIPLADVRAV